jgi:hypothetical protein
LIDGEFTVAHRDQLLAELQAAGGTVIRELEIGTAVTSIANDLFQGDRNLTRLTFKDPRNSRCATIKDRAFARCINLVVNTPHLVLPPSITTLRGLCFSQIDFDSVTFLGGPGVPILYGQSQFQTGFPIGLPSQVFMSSNPLVNGSQDLNDGGGNADLGTFGIDINTTQATFDGNGPGTGGGGVIDRSTDITFS